MQDYTHSTYSALDKHEGASMVSFLLVIPIVLIVLLAMIQFGLVAFERSVVSDVVRWTGSVAQVDHRLRDSSIDLQNGRQVRENAKDEIEAKGVARFEALMGTKAFADYDFEINLPAADSLDEEAFVVRGHATLKELPLFPIFKNFVIESSAAFLAEPKFTSTMPAVITCFGTALSSASIEEFGSAPPNCPCENDPDPRKQIGKEGACECRPTFVDDGRGNCVCAYGSVPVQREIAGFVYESCDCPSCGESPFILNPDFGPAAMDCSKNPMACEGINLCECSCIRGATGDPTLGEGEEGSCSCPGNKVFTGEGSSSSCECPDDLCDSHRMSLIETDEGCDCECRNYGSGSSTPGLNSNGTAFEMQVNPDGSRQCVCTPPPGKTSWDGVTQDPDPSVMCPASHPIYTASNPGATPEPICDACLSCWTGAGGANTGQYAAGGRCGCTARNPVTGNLVAGAALDSLRAHCGDQYVSATHPRGCTCSNCPPGQVSLKTIRTSGSGAYKRDECGCPDLIDCPADRQHIETCSCICLEDGEPKECSIHEELDEDCECVCEEGSQYPLRNIYGEYVDHDGQVTGDPVYACQPPGDYCGSPGGCYWEGGEWRAPE